ncbi:MAG: hypothetical protein NT150_00995 [Bacteroidetes bacterium]|nr:hypothetical protein [Bacteroidota bacterium]
MGTKSISVFIGALLLFAACKKQPNYYDTPQEDLTKVEEKIISPCTNLKMNVVTFSPYKLNLSSVSKSVNSSKLQINCTGSKGDVDMVLYGYAKSNKNKVFDISNVYNNSGNAKISISVAYDFYSPFQATSGQLYVINQNDSLFVEFCDVSLANQNSQVYTMSGRIFYDTL